MEISFCELRKKEVVNIFDGKQLGRIIDLTIDVSCARVTGIVVPNSRCGINVFKSNTDLYIPYNRICKIGTDVILVDLNYTRPNNARILNTKEESHPDTNQSTQNPNETNYENLKKHLEKNLNTSNNTTNGYMENPY